VGRPSPDGKSESGRMGSINPSHAIFHCRMKI
jgi:hypothetical protein